MILLTSPKTDQRVQLLHSLVQKFGESKIAVKIDSIRWVFQFGIYINQEAWIS